MKYNIVAKFVFLNVEADSEELAQEYCDVKFTHYIRHPETDEKIFALYEIEAVEHEMHQTGLTAAQEKEIEKSIKAYQNGEVKESPRW